MKRATRQIHLNTLHQNGILGEGVGVAVLDTGINPHPDLVYPQNRIVGFFDAIHGRVGTYDDSSHGTNVAGIVAGNGYLSSRNYVGIAPKCHLVGVKVLNHHGEGYVNHFMKGIEWILENRERYGIRIANISVASVRDQLYGEQSEFVKRVDEMWDVGIIVVASAGNLGPGKQTIGAPGNSRKIITVGSSDEEFRFAGNGPTFSCIKKPDVVAPGYQIISCGMNRRKEYGYTAKSGTSMSCPMVSGAVALLLSKYPHMSNLQVKIRLKNATTDLGRSHASQGWGMLDITKLLCYNED